MDNCPNCNSKSGIDVHGRQFCHACHKNFPGKGRDLIEVERKSNKIEMPEWDTTDIFPEEAYEYLSKYHYGRDKNVFWSSKYSRLCFPYYSINTYGETVMIGCWMRSLDKQPSPGSGQRPKWLMAGQKDFCWVYRRSYFILQKCLNTEAVCLVEDVISAIRVSEFMDCICLGGTSINIYTKKTLKDYKNVYIFLDGDEAGKTGAEKLRKELKLTHNVRVIRAKKDPKEFDSQCLREVLL